MCYSFAGAWTWDEFAEAVRAAHNLFDAGGRKRVHLIFDMRAAHGTPTSGFSDLPDLLKADHPQSGLFIVIGSRNLMAIMLSQGLLVWVQEAHGALPTFEYVATLEAARELIQQYEE